VGRHPSVRKTGAQVHWGIDEPAEIESWGPGIRLLEEWYFTQSDDIAKLGFWYSLVFRLAASFAAARKAHRILLFQL